MNHSTTDYAQLELFDLDEAFSSEKARLAQITNKCGDEDVEYFVREAADILGITSAAIPALANPSAGKDVAKNILEYVFAHLVEFKKLNHDHQQHLQSASAIQDDVNEEWGEKVIPDDVG